MNHSIISDLGFSSKDFFLLPGDPMGGATIAVVCNPQGIENIVKVYRSTSSLSYWFNEHTAFNSVSSDYLLQSHVPKLIKAGIIMSKPYLVYDFIHGKHVVIDSNDRECLLDFLHHHRKLFNRIATIGSTSDYDAIFERKIEYLRSMNQHVISSLLDKLLVLLSPHKHQLSSLLVGLSHGDFTTHNMLLTPNDGLFIIDWADSSFDRPVFYDIVNIQVVNLIKSNRFKQNITSYSFLDNLIEKWINDNRSSFGCLFPHKHSRHVLPIYLIERLYYEAGKYDTNLPEYMKSPLGRMPTKFTSISDHVVFD